MKNPTFSRDPYRRAEQIMERLREPGGCPWDRRQTHQSLKPYLIEEAHECLEAIDQRDPKALREELGDVLLQVYFHARLAEEKGLFNMRDVVRGLGDKLVRRHPHVFGQAGKSSVAQVNARWEQIKKLEKPERKSPLEGLPKSLPALHRAQRMHEKLSKGGKKENPVTLLRETRRAWAAFQKGLGKNRARVAEGDLGDFLLALTALAQVEGLHAEMALRKASNRLESAHRAR